MRKHIRRACVHRSQIIRSKYPPNQIPLSSSHSFIPYALTLIRTCPLTQTAIDRWWPPNAPEKHAQHARAQQMTCANARHNGGEAHTERMRPSTAVAVHHAHHTRRKGDSRCALPLSSFPSCPRSSSHPQPPAHATKEASKSNEMCILCVHVVVCACRHTKQRSKNRSRACEGTHKQKRTAEVHGRNKEKKTAQAHNIALQKKQRQFIKKLIKINKRKFIFTLPHLTLWKKQKRKEEKKKMKKSSPLLRLHTNKTKKKKKKEKKKNSHTKKGTQLPCCSRNCLHILSENKIKKIFKCLSTV
ncbi:hypothetical protein ECC02_007608 [Trypanosoma cruzi]|uniref:Uncharacterized protein n=1 Tax=Trypanosoma cruzi TaxID=5693 RepID=A0A7J6XXY9_TRYCR|nr:hypothetical protein ECC02_007608 [Trypanosoma cruzi]